MPARARKEIVDGKSPGYYLVTQRVVRGLRLTGVDGITGRDYSYRQAKLERRIRELAGLYLIEIAEFTCGADGFDLLVRTRPDLLPSLTNEDVVRRMLRRSEKQLELKPPPSEEAVSAALADAKRLTKLRARIVNLSQFMGDVDEAMARDVNRESGGGERDLPLGRLWHGRFNSVRVLDPPALLLAAAYVESKKVVDGEAGTIETAACSSAALRARTLHGQDAPAERDASSETSVERQPLTKVELSAEGPEELADDLRRENHRVTQADAWLLPMVERLSTVASDPFESGPYLGIAFSQFRRLLRWTLERTKAVGESGKADVDDELVSVFERFRLRVDVWVEAVKNFRRWFRTAIGLGDAMKSFAKRLGVAWLAGQGRRHHPFTE